MTVTPRCLQRFDWRFPVRSSSGDLKKVDVSSRRDWQPLPAACDKPLAQRRAVLAVEQ